MHTYYLSLHQTNNIHIEQIAYGTHMFCHSTYTVVALVLSPKFQLNLWRHD